MGCFYSIVECFDCMTNRAEVWPEVCEDPDNKLDRWMGSLPSYDFQGLEKIKYEPFQNLMMRLVKDNVIDFNTVDEVIGHNRNKRPRLIRISKKLDFSTLTLYERLQFLSLAYPRVARLETGNTSGFHGFINVQKTKRYVFAKEPTATLDIFHDKVKHTREKKIMVFNHNTRKPEYKTHNFEKRISWDVGGITTVKIAQVMSWFYIRHESINKNNIDEKTNKLLKNLELDADRYFWGLKKFIQSILESYKSLPSRGLDFYWHIYESSDICHLIRNGNIPDLLKNENDKRIFVESINKIPFFENNPVTFMDIFGDERGNHKLIRHDETYFDTSVFDCQRSVMLRKFYNEYTVVGNYTWANSNINIKNINSEYTIPNGMDYTD